MNVAADLDLLVELVCEVGRNLLAWREERPVGGIWKGTQLKTEADRRAHALLHRGLTAALPDMPCISEEDAAGQTCSRPRRYWLIDPIDGTASYSGGFDGFVVQGALMQDEHPQVAAVFAPAMDRLYTAMRGEGARLNGEPMARLVFTGLPVLIDNHPQPTGFSRMVFEGMQCDGYVESGSLGLKICRVADGTASLFAKDVPLRDWDIAPAALVLEEAGGWLGLPDGSAFPFTGAWEKQGVVAAASSELGARFVAWYAARETSFGRE